MDRRARSDITWGQVLLGIVLVAVPTTFTVLGFELTAIPKWVKGLALGGWVVVAAILVWHGVRRDRSIAEVTAAVALQRDQIRNAAEGMIFDVLLMSGKLFPESYSFIAYLYDEAQDLLVPIWPRDMSPGRAALVSFKPGKGATGLAWEREDVVAITGEAVYNDDHNLTPEQQAHWKGHEVVVSAPIFTDTQVKIGALTGISKPDDRYFEELQGQALLRQTASTLGVVLRAVRADG